MKTMPSKQKIENGLESITETQDLTNETLVTASNLQNNFNCKECGKSCECLKMINFSTTCGCKNQTCASYITNVTIPSHDRLAITQKYGLECNVAKLQFPQFFTQNNMMHYRKGENIEKQLTKEELPFEDFLPKGTEFLWMHVNGGTKVNNVLTYAKNALEKGEYKHVVWSGNGGGVVKTISCAEILKRTFPLYQVTRTCYTTVEEHWKPQMEGLEEIVANRQIPSLHIYMSLEPIEDSVAGLQKPNTKTDFWFFNSNNQTPSTSSSNSNNQRSRNSNQGHRRPNYNQHKNQSQQPQQQHQNSSNNQDQRETINSSTSKNNPQRSSNNKPKRRQPYQNHDRVNQDQPKKEDSNSKQPESMES